MNMRVDRIILLLLGFIRLEEAAPTMNVDASQCPESKLKYIFVLSPQVKQMNFLTNAIGRTRLGNVEKPEKGPDNVWVVIEPKEFLMFKELTKSLKVYRSHSWRCGHSSKKKKSRPRTNVIDDTSYSSLEMKRFPGAFKKNLFKNRFGEVDGTTLVRYERPLHVFTTPGRAKISDIAQNQRDKGNSVQNFSNNAVDNFLEINARKNNGKESTNIAETYAKESLVAEKKIFTETSMIEKSSNYVRPTILPEIEFDDKKKISSEMKEWRNFTIFSSIEQSERFKRQNGEELTEHVVSRASQLSKKYRRNDEKLKKSSKSQTPKKSKIMSDVSHRKKSSISRNCGTNKRNCQLNWNGKNDTKIMRKMKQNRKKNSQKSHDSCADGNSHCYSIKFTDCCGSEDQVKVSTALRDTTKRLSEKKNSPDRDKKHKSSGIVGNYESLGKDLELLESSKKYGATSTIKFVSRTTPVHVSLSHEEFSPKIQNLEDDEQLSDANEESDYKENVKLSEISDDDESYIPLDDLQE